MSVEWADDPKKTERGPVDGPKKINRAGLKSGRRSSRGRPRHADRPFVEAMMWIARTGSPWRDLPESYPNWRSVYTRWRRWVRQALWSKNLDGNDLLPSLVPRARLARAPGGPLRITAGEHPRTHERVGSGSPDGVGDWAGTALPVWRNSRDCATFV